MRAFSSSRWIEIGITSDGQSLEAEKDFPALVTLYRPLSKTLTARLSPPAIPPTPWAHDIHLITVCFTTVLYPNQNGAHYLSVYGKRWDFVQLHLSAHLLRIPPQLSIIDYRTKNFHTGIDYELPHKKCYRKHD
jgi:hypothetical protein